LGVGRQRHVATYWVARRTGRAGMKNDQKNGNMTQKPSGQTAGMAKNPGNMWIVGWHATCNPFPIPAGHAIHAR